MARTLIGGVGGHHGVTFTFGSGVFTYHVLYMFLL